jgi:calcineurin-like phosphoesterase family protein
MRYYTADPHFGHENIIDLCDRPFASLEEMEKAVIEAWMQCLSRTDELYILGDLGGPSSSTEHVRSQVGASPAPVQWIKGNHDRDSWVQDLEGVADFQGDRMEIKTDRVDPRDDHPVFRSYVEGSRFQ